MKKEIVSVPGFKPVKHLSRAVRFGNLVFVSGATGTDPATGKMADDITGQSKQVMENIKAVLAAAGTSMENVVKTTCYLAEFKDKDAFNEVYISYFSVDPPARACFAVGDLGPGVKIEVESIACIPD